MIKDWLYVKESSICNLPQEEYSILPALRLSYLNLLTKLRQCIALVILTTHPMEVDDDGDRVWNELFLISFFEVVDIASVQC